MAKESPLPHPTRHYAEIHKRVSLACWGNISQFQRDLIVADYEDEAEAFTRWVNARATEIYLNPEHPANSVERWMDERVFVKRN